MSQLAITHSRWIWYKVITLATDEPLKRNGELVVIIIMMGFLAAVSVFKYAGRGYGIRFLPSYLDAIKSFELKELELEGHFDKKLKKRAKSFLQDINKAASDGRKFFNLYYEEESQGELMSILVTPDLFL
jgi:hypothetical protein